MKKLIATLVVATMAIGLVACGNQDCAVDDEAAIRVEMQNPDGVVYIDDEFVALSGEIVETTAREQELATMAIEAFNLTNANRIAAGLPAYVWSPELVIAAQIRAKESAKQFSHTRPDGTSYWTVNSNIVYGENLARGYNSAKSMVEGWMNSPTHKANIMDRELVTVGIAIYEAADGKLYVAQEFGY